MKKILIISLSVALLIIVPLVIYPHFSCRMKYIQPTHTYYIKKIQPNYNYTKSEIREKLNKLTNVSLYFYSEKDLNDGVYGRTQLLFRNIELENDLTENKYIEVMCHELMHLKYYTINERFTTYQTFVTLYNSEFKQVALNMVHDMHYGKYPYEYECHAQIVEYLEKQPI